MLLSEPYNSCLGDKPGWTSATEAEHQLKGYMQSQQKRRRHLFQWHLHGPAQALKTARSSHPSHLLSEPSAVIQPMVLPR